MGAHVAYLHDRVRDLLALEHEQETLAHKMSELDPASPEYAQVADRFYRAAHNKPEELRAAEWTMRTRRTCQCPCRRKGPDSWCFTAPRTAAPAFHAV